MSLELTSALGGNGWAVAEYTLSGVNQGLFPGAPVGVTFSVRTATVLEHDGDQIVRSSDYYDVATILAQLGVPLGTDGTPVPTLGP